MVLAIREGVILQQAFPRLVTFGAIHGMIQEEKFQDRFLSVLHHGIVGHHHHVVLTFHLAFRRRGADGRLASRDQLGHPLDLNQTHSTTGHHT